MSTPEKIYMPPSIWVDRFSPGKDVEYIRADIHKAQIDALKAENADCRAKYAKVTAMLASHYVLLPEVEP